MSKNHGWQILVTQDRRNIEVTLPFGIVCCTRQRTFANRCAMIVNYIVVQNQALFCLNNSWTVMNLLRCIAEPSINPLHWVYATWLAAGKSEPVQWTPYLWIIVWSLNCRIQPRGVCCCTTVPKVTSGPSPRLNFKSCRRWWHQRLHQLDFWP